MNRRNKQGAVVAAALVLCAYASVASAQDPPPKPGTTAAPRTQPQDPRTATPATAREEAVQSIPAWEEFGSTTDTENLEETFFRLSRDFVSTAEIGVRRLGHVPVWPRGDLKLGPVRIFPYLREAVEYESNFYRQPNTGRAPGSRGADSAWTHVHQVGALADMILCNGRARIFGAAESTWNVRYDKDKADTWELDSQLGASFRWPSGFWVKGGVAYERRDDPIEIEFTDRFKRTNKRGFLEWGFDRDVFFGSKVQMEMGVSTRNSKSREDALDDLDRTETTWYAKASYPFWKKTTRIFGRLRYRQDERESDSINDGDVFGFDAGIEGHIPIREGEYRGLRGTLSMGFDRALYDDDTFTRGSDRIVADSDSNNTSLHVEAALQYLVSPRTSIDLRYLRTNQFSFRGNYQIVDRVDLTFNHNFTRAIVGRVGAFYEHTDPSGTLPARTTDDDIDVRQAPNVNRGGIGVGVRYAINDWMDIDASVDWEKRNAEAERSYSNYRGILGITFYLNALKPRAAAPRPQ